MSKGRKYSLKEKIKIVKEYLSGQIFVKENRLKIWIY
jgi:hypothetical protein